MKKIKLTEHTVAIQSLPPEFAGYRILQISDAHLGRGDQAESVLKAVSGLSVDLVALTGDLVRRRRGNVHSLRSFLSELPNRVRAVDGFFATWGNHDYRVPDRQVAGLPVRWLNNELICIRRETAALNVIGVNQKVWASTDLLHPLAEAIVGAPIIVLAHYPSTAYLLNGIIDLVIAGHTHAGQIRIPGLPFATNDDLSWRNARGVSKIGNCTLVVSAGIGSSGFLPFRLFAPREVTIIQLACE